MVILGISNTQRKDSIKPLLVFISVIIIEIFIFIQLKKYKSCILNFFIQYLPLIYNEYIIPSD